MFRCIQIEVVKGWCGLGLVWRFIYAQGLEKNCYRENENEDEDEDKAVLRTFITRQLRIPLG